MLAQEKRTDWIDVAKSCAILAVILDHTNGSLYTNSNIGYLSYFSVEVFILMMGITSYWSYQRKGGEIRKKVTAKCLGIIKPYLMATFIYTVCDHKFFSLKVFWDNAIHFSTRLPFYYVFLYLQLVMIAPVIFQLFCFSSKKHLGWLLEVLFLGAAVIISSYTTRFTSILNIYGGGGKLFGGTYLVVFYLGMWFGKYYPQMRIKPLTAFGGLAVCLFLSVCWWRFISINRFQIDRCLPFGNGENPPSISLIVYGVLIGSTIFFGGQLPKELFGGLYQKAFSGAARLGKHTLYIFLYHLLFLEFFITGFVIENIWLKRAVYFGAAILGPLLVEAVLKKIGKIISSAYRLSH